MLITVGIYPAQMGPRHRRRNCAFAPCFGVGAIGIYDVWEYDLEVTCDTGINFDDVESKRLLEGLVTYSYYPHLSLTRAPAKYNN